MFDGLEILNLLKDKRVLGVNLLSEYVFKQLNLNLKMYDYSSQIINIDDEEFKLADDDDDDEQDGTRYSINTTKEDFVGMKVFNTCQPQTEHSYFKVTINDDIKYMHKQTACWLLTGEKNKISNDRLLRVQQTNKKN